MIPESKTRRLARRLAVVLTGAAVVWLYFWIARPAVSQLLGNHSAKTAYYNRLSDGFLAGHLHLAGDPPPELAKLKNAYDPVENAPYRLHDATYYRGKYYLYFGVTPALVLFLPYTLVTGEYLWHRQAVAIFGAAGFLVSVGLLVAIRRRYFPRAGPATMGFAVLALGMVNTVPIVLRRPDVWEVPITCAACFVMLALAALWRALHAPGRRFAWTAAASLAYGLALGARPPILFGAVVLLAPAAYVWWRERADRRTVARLVTAAVLPVAAVGVALLWYNWLRFDDPLQFGQKYQLAGVDNTRVRFFSPEYFWYHLRLYLWEPVRWSTYFPFVVGIDVPPPPPGQLGVESMFGALTNTPFVWLGLAAFWLGRRLPPAAAPLRWTLGAAALFTVVCGLTVCLFGGACNRYFVDFLPPWVLVSAVGLLALEGRLVQVSRWGRLPVRAAWGGAVVFSAAFIFFSSCEHLGLLRLRDPDGYARLARFFNRPVWWVETWLAPDRSPASRFGPMELTLRLPPFTDRRPEPLYVSGAPRQADYIWIEYVSPELVRFGLEHTGYGGPASAYVPADYGREHTVTLQFRSLLPPDEHPYWETPQGRQQAETRNDFRLLFNDREVLQGTFEGYDASPQTRFIGRSPYVKALGATFTGDILSVRTLGMAADPRQMRAPGPVAFKLWLPKDAPPGLTEPLVQTGAAGQADTLWIRYVDHQHVSFGLDHWSYGGPESAPIPVDYLRVQRMEVRMGSLYPADSGLKPDDPRLRRLEVKLDGRVVFAAEQDFYPASGDQVYFGRNPLGASTATQRLTARITDLRRLGVTKP